MTGGVQVGFQCSTCDETFRYEDYDFKGRAYEAAKLHVAEEDHGAPRDGVVGLFE